MSFATVSNNVRVEISFYTELASDKYDSLASTGHGFLLLFSQGRVVKSCETLICDAQKVSAFYNFPSNIAQIYFIVHGGAGDLAVVRDLEKREIEVVDRHNNVKDFFIEDSENSGVPTLKIVKHFNSLPFRLIKNVAADDTSLLSSITNSQVDLNEHVADHISKCVQTIRCSEDSRGNELQWKQSMVRRHLAGGKGHLEPPEFSTPLCENTESKLPDGTPQLMINDSWQRIYSGTWIVVFTLQNLTDRFIKINTVSSKDKGVKHFKFKIINTKNYLPNLWSIQTTRHVDAKSTAYFIVCTPLLSVYEEKVIQTQFTLHFDGTFLLSPTLSFNSLDLFAKRYDVFKLDNEDGNTGKDLLSLLAINTNVNIKMNIPVPIGNLFGDIVKNDLIMSSVPQLGENYWFSRLEPCPGLLLRFKEKSASECYMNISAKNADQIFTLLNALNQLLPYGSNMQLLEA